MLLSSYSPTAKNMGVGLRSCEVTPELSIDVASMYVYVCSVCLCESFLSAISLDQAPRHLLLSWSQGSKNTVPLARTGYKAKFCCLQMYLSVRKIPCAPVRIDLQWFLVSQHLADIKCRVILHLFYNSASTKLSLIAMINIHMHTYLPIPNLKIDLSHSG